MLYQNNQKILNQQSESNSSQKVKFSLKIKNNPQIECYISIGYGNDFKLLPMLLDSATQDEMIMSVDLPVKEQVVYNYLYQIKQQDGILKENFPRLFKYSNSCQNQIDEWNKYYYRFIVNETILCLADIFQIQVVREDNSTIDLQKCQNLNDGFEGFELIENNNKPVNRYFKFQCKSNPSAQFQSKPVQITNQSIQMNCILIQFNLNQMENQASKMKALFDNQIIIIEKQEQEKNNVKQKELDLLVKKEQQLRQNLQLQRNENFNQEQYIQKTIKLQAENQKLDKLKLEKLRYETEQFKQKFENQNQQFLISIQQDRLVSQIPYQNNILKLQEEIKFKKQQNDEDLHNLQKQSGEQLSLYKQSLLAATNQLDELMQNKVENQIQSVMISAVQIDQSEEIPQNIKQILSQLQSKIEELEESSLDEQKIMQDKEKSYKFRMSQIQKKQEQVDACLKSCKLLKFEIKTLKKEVQIKNDRVNLNSQIIIKLKKQIKQAIFKLDQQQVELAESLKQIEASNEKSQSLKSDLMKMDQDFKEKQEKQINQLQSLYKKAEDEIQRIVVENKKNKEKFRMELKTQRELQLLHYEKQFNIFEKQLQQNHIDEFFKARKEFFDKVGNYQSEVKVLIVQIIDDIEKNQIWFCEIEKSQIQQDQLNRFQQLVDAIKVNQDVFLIDELLQFIKVYKDKVYKSKQEESEDIGSELLLKIEKYLGQLKKLINYSVKESNELYSSNKYQEQFKELISKECQQYYERLQQSYKDFD